MTRFPALAPEIEVVVFFGGFTGTGAVGLRKAMIASGHGNIPFLSWDGLFDGSGADKGSYIQGVTAAGSAGSYVSHATQPPTKNTFVEAYRQAYGAEPDEYAAAAYACVKVIVESLRAVAADRPSTQGLREALRAYVVDPRHHHETVVGAMSVSTPTPTRFTSTSPSFESTLQLPAERATGSSPSSRTTGPHHSRRVAASPTTQVAAVIRRRP